MNSLSSIHHTNFNRLYELTNNYNKATLLDKLIYWWQISKYTLDDEKIWFTRSIEQIAADSKISQRSVERYLKEFNDANYIEKKNKLFKKKNLYIRITEKLLQAIGAATIKPCAKASDPTTQNSLDVKKDPASETFFAQNGGTNPAILAESTYKEKDSNYLTNNTVNVSLAVDKSTKNKNLSLLKYPLFTVEKIIGERIDERSKNYIKGMLINLQQHHNLNFSSPEQLFAEIVFSILNKEQIRGVDEFKHRVQIIAKLLREKRWLTPKGFYNHADYSQRFRTNYMKRDIPLTIPTRKIDKLYEDRAKVKELKAKISELNVLINSETHYLDETTKNWNQDQSGSQALLDSITNKLTRLGKQRTVLQQELIELETQTDSNFIGNVHQDLSNDYKRFNELQDEISELGVLANNAFEEFCEANKYFNKDDTTLDKLYKHYEQLHSRMTESEKQMMLLEQRLFQHQAA